MKRFVFQPKMPENIIFGPDAVRETGRLAKNNLNSKKILIVTDKGLRRTGIPDNLELLLKDEQMDAEVYDEIFGEPKENEINRALEYFFQGNFDTVVGLGGGSALDAAKVIAAIGQSGIQLEDIYGNDKIPGRKAGLLLIPTTAGTGSEATPNALFSDSTNTKNAVVSKYLLPDYVVLDPILTVGLPPAITAFTGVDALCHCMESYISVNSNAISRSLSYQGVELIWSSLPVAVANPSDIAARSDMLIGSLLGGMALTIAGTTAVHAMAYPLGKRNVAHGVANGLLLPAVFEYESHSCRQQFASLAPALKIHEANEKDASQAVVSAIRGLLDSLPVPKTLRDVGISGEEIRKMASEALLNERLLKNNPVPLTEEDMVSIYTNSL